MMTSPVFLRWGEVVLNRAEAYAKTGKDAQALDDVNTIRKRAGLTGDALMTTSNIKARVYVRPNFTRGKGVRFNMGGSYAIYYCSKFSYQDGMAMMTSPVFLRWGEVVLNRAEAEAKLGQDAKALDDVNIIRTRAGIPALTSGDVSSLGYKNMLELVLDERRMELCFEGHRFFDVFRNNLPMDRRYVGYHTWEIIQPNDPRIALLISQDEINSAGIPQNPR